MKKVHPYRVIEREYITSDISIRELCRRHDTSAHSLVTVQAKKNGWHEKREAYRSRASESFIEKHAQPAWPTARREIRHKALDAIDEAVTKFRDDMRATTKPVRQPDSSIIEEPAWLMTPRDLAFLIDRFQVLFARPSSISQHQDLTVSTDISADALREFMEATRGRGEPSRMEVSPLPRTRRLDD